MRQRPTSTKEVQSTSRCVYLNIIPMTRHHTISRLKKPSHDAEEEATRVLLSILDIAFGGPYEVK